MGKRAYLRQFALTGIFEASLASNEKRILAYATSNRSKYLGFARFITPCHDNWEQVWDRLAFAILSANTPFDSSVSGLAYAVKHRGEVDGKTLTTLGQNLWSRKANHLNLLPLGKDALKLCQEHGEPWKLYRLRLREVKGLGLCKASFAAGLLYPTTSDLACIDTWIHKVFIGGSFKQLNLETYETVEARIRALGFKVGVNTFIMQWMIWDHVRKSVTNHAIFPGAHKGG